MFGTLQAPHKLLVSVTALRSRIAHSVSVTALRRRIVHSVSVTALRRRIVHSVSVTAFRRRIVHSVSEAAILLRAFALPSRGWYQFYFVLFTENENESLHVVIESTHKGVNSARALSASFCFRFML